MTLKQTWKSITPKEKKIVWLLTILTFLITTIPYLVGYINTPEGFVYTGLHAITSADIPVYYSYINQIQNGNFFCFGFVYQ